MLPHSRSLCYFQMLSMLHTETPICSTKEKSIQRPTRLCFSLENTHFCLLFSAPQALHLLKYFCFICFSLWLLVTTYHLATIVSSQKSCSVRVTSLLKIPIYYYPKTWINSIFLDLMIALNKMTAGLVLAIALLPSPTKDKPIEKTLWALLN